jgi:hypothetical protein
MKREKVLAGFSKKGIIYRKDKRSPEGKLIVLDDNGHETPVKCRFFNDHRSGDLRKEGLAEISTRFRINDLDFIWGVVECPISREALIERLHTIWSNVVFSPN